jgi:hypothetical protein
MFDIEIKLLSMDMLDKEGHRSVRARVSIMIGPIEVLDVRVIENEGSPVKVRLPSYKVSETHEGSRFEWRPYVILPNNLKHQVDEIVLKEYQLRKARLESD